MTLCLHWFAALVTTAAVGTTSTVATTASVTAATGTTSTVATNATGSCYNMTSHQVTCGILQSDCGKYWYPQNYRNKNTGCCHCKEGCTEIKASCKYNDVGSCYTMSTHKVSCNVMLTACSGNGVFWYRQDYRSTRDGCCHCQQGCTNILASCSYYDQSAASTSTLPAAKRPEASTTPRQTQPVMPLAIFLTARAFFT